MRTDLELELHGLNMRERDATLAAVARLTRTLTVREIDHALARHGLPRAQRYPLISAIKHIAIVAIAEAE